ncbi:YjjI family glycine radical enzyme [Actinomarinicola tropica]|uniref:YjjI family glycine radical enzyme n=1 Tax=Actinomarinicola tropica TaxID=2789776 RepID=A0A5Q2RBU7_9ACTN|nr:YjjI family glycine radical enzyme [Actinomarinicola tropica]QGG94308.1 YjjI family glycine radical enzyme [Actinomarinicola tropica]
MGAEEHRQRVRSIIEDPALTYRQRVYALAGAAEDALDPPAVSAACALALDKGLICDLAEGHAPYRPRYTLPDYARALARGSTFLELPPPTTFDEATTFLLAAYANVPSITGYPVWFGDLDRLLEPFAADLDDDELRTRLRRFWVLLDRLFPDAFAHANLGPADGRVVRAALGVHRDVHQVVPNLTLRVDPDVTPDDLLLEAARTIVTVAQPHLVNHPMMVADLGERYGVVSCYNALPVGGGSHTLVRLNLLEAARRHSGSAERFLDTTLPGAIALTAELMEARIRHVVEQARFFESSWLVDEGLLSLDRFTAMFGIVGLAECVEHLLLLDGREGRYGRDRAADDLAHDIVERAAAIVHALPMPHCEATGGHALLHSQAGLDSDAGFTAGTRVRVGDEPDLYRHLAAVAPNHAHLPSGVSDIVRLDETVVDNPEAVVDVARGALALGMRDVTFEVANGEFVRVTGYLVRRSEIEKVAAADAVRHSSSVLGAGSFANAGLDRRTAQRVRSHERTVGT